MTLNETKLEERFEMVSTSQGSIQSLSFFCLHYKAHHKKIAHIWLRSLQKAKTSHRLTLVYLANDIVQNAKRKNTLSFIDDFKLILKDTIPYLRDEKIKKSVDRVFSIWQDRNIYDVKFINELKSLLNNNSRKSDESSTNSHSNAINTTTTTTTTASSDKSKSKTNDLLDSLNKLADIEKKYENLKTHDPNVMDCLEQGSIDTKDAKTLNDLKEYFSYIKTEIDERSKLAKLLEDSMNNQKKLLKESEDQLNIYKSQLDYIIKLRDDII